MTPPLPDPGVIKAAMASPRWSALVRVDATVQDIRLWDPSLLRETRVLVPIDVQALYVDPTNTAAHVSLPFGLTEPDGKPAAPMPSPFDPGTPRVPGVYLHWAMPDALLRGSLTRQPDGATNRLGLPALPDRWLVLRMLVMSGAPSVQTTGWVILADTGTVVPLDDWHGEQALPPAARHTVASAKLTGTVGGSPQWASTYDAVVDRFAFYDSLSVLSGSSGPSTEGNQVGYLVTGWWSQAALDPLDAARTDASLHDTLDGLGWHLAATAGDPQPGIELRTVDALKRASLGLVTGARYDAHGAALGVRPGLLAGGGSSDTTSAIADAITPTTRFVSAVTPFADLAQRVVTAEPRFPRSTLLHGMVHGVPFTGPVDPSLVNQPAPTDLSIELGHQGDDVAATVASDGFGESEPESRRAAERLLSAFSGHLLDRLATADGLVDVEEHEHASAFTALSGGTLGTDRVKMGDASAPLTAGAPGRSTANRQAAAAAALNETRISWAGRTRFELEPDDGVALRRQVLEWTAPQPVTEPASEVREIARPAPRYHVPSPPTVAVRGLKRSMRQRSTKLHSPDEQLQVRWPSQVLRAPSLALLATVLPAVPTGAVPPEVVALSREALLLNPYLAPWLARVTADDPTTRAQGMDGKAIQTRFFAESAMRYGAQATYTGRSTFLGADLGELAAIQVADQLRRYSIYEGVEPSPVAVTAWSQPWQPIWLEWEVAIAETDDLPAWTLGQIDLEPPEAVTPTGRVLSATGRSVLTTGVAATMAAAITDWLAAEEARDVAGTGELDQAEQDALASLRSRLDTFDVLSVVLDGLRDQLLGVPYLDGRTEKPVPDDSIPELLLRGELRITRARLVDAFGQVVDLPDVGDPGLPARDEVDTPMPALRIRPRLTVPARWLFRFVDPAGPAADAPEARLDQVDTTQTVNPVAGFLLPDHIDEALEVFDVAGNPLGQLLHEPFGGGVVWEPAPGRPLPQDAGPLEGLGPQQLLVGHLAAGVVAADAVHRGGRPAQPETESCLSAMLRAVDTTLWSVDTYAALGNEHIAGLVGRPIAVVRARLSLDVQSDVDQLDLSDPDKLVRREHAYRDLAALSFPVRIGELTRQDDGLLGFFVDDDYLHFHVVDKVVASSAFVSGRGQGQLGTYGETPAADQLGTAPLTADFVVAEDELHVHPGQTVTLTLLMHPAGRVHLTSGVLPRKSLALQRDWVAPGLTVMAPSARIGPVLVDPARIALPLISSFGKDQLWTRRDTPLTWKDDPILAATQTALLPDLPHEVQEGYIRIAPAPPPGASGATAGGG
jgi:hypothetical protein